MTQQTHRHFIMHKPYGIVCQFYTNDLKAKNKRFLSEIYDFPEAVMPVGRLDEKSEGLLLLTTDGKLSDTINQSGVEKEYYAQVDGVATSEAIKKLETGVEIGFEGTRYCTKPCKVTTIENPNFPERSKKVRDNRHGPTSWISITITEGKFRQVRKMTAAVGFPTLRLVRVRIGTYTLDSLKNDELRELTTSFEI